MDSLRESQKKVLGVLLGLGSWVVLATCAERDKQDYAKLCEGREREVHISLPKTTGVTIRCPKPTTK